MTKELKLWEGKFGDEYTERNLITENDISHRTNMWNCILNSMYVNDNYKTPESILEIGAGQGLNIITLNKIYKTLIRKEVDIFGIEPNKKTLKIAKENTRSPNVSWVGNNAFNIDLPDHYIDLVFTSGVLIHINPDDLLQAYKEMYRVTKKYIVTLEYFSPDVRKVEYHGEQAMWTMDYGKYWIDNFPVRFLGCLFFWKPVYKVDNLTCWIFEKVN